MAEKIRIALGPGGEGEIRLELNFTKFNDNIRKEIVKRLKTTLELLKTRIQRNISKSNRAGGPSKPGEFPKANTGRLRNSIFWQINEVDLSGFVGTNLRYGLWLELGTKGGAIIVPKNAKALSWIDHKTGQRRYAKRVVQGAIQGRSYIRRTFRESEQVVASLWTKPFPKAA